MVQPSLPEPDENGNYPETPPLRRLRLLVTTLTVVLIAGVLTVSVVLVIKLTGGGIDLVAPGPPGLPETVLVPEGARIVAVGRGAPGEVLVVLEGPGEARSLRSYDTATGALLDTAEIVAE